MKENKNPTDAGTSAGAETAAALAGGTAIPKNDFITRQGPISSVLCIGKENAVTGAEIRRVLGLSSGRDVTALVEQERHSGVPICATCNSKRPGYYLPQTPGELDTYNRSLSRRIKNVTATLDAMQRAADSWSGQQRIDLDDGGGSDV